MFKSEVKNEVMWGKEKLCRWHPMWHSRWHSRWHSKWHPRWYSNDTQMIPKNKQPAEVWPDGHEGDESARKIIRYRNQSSSARRTKQPEDESFKACGEWKVFLSLEEKRVYARHLTLRNEERSAQSGQYANAQGHRPLLAPSLL